MNSAYLLLGSNLGEREQYLQRAETLLAEEFRLVKISPIYQSAPWGFESRNLFLNRAVMVEGNMEPEQLLKSCKRIEKKLGRKEHEPEYDTEGRRVYSSRLIDIDILLFYRETEAVVMENDNLTIPHPLMAQRRFALEPLARIAGELLHPVLKRSINELLSQLRER